MGKVGVGGWGGGQVRTHGATRPAIILLKVLARVALRPCSRVHYISIQTAQQRRIESAEPTVVMGT